MLGDDFRLCIIKVCFIGFHVNNILYCSFTTEEDHRRVAETFGSQLTPIV